MLKQTLKKIVPIQYHWQLYNTMKDVVGWRSKSYSSFGEDLVVSKLAGNIRNGFFVDVGAFHPYKYSNTYYLKKYFAWTGINIEPNPQNFQLFLKKRQDDINLNVGVSQQSGDLDYFMFPDPLYNTFDKNRSQELLAQGMELVGQKTIPVQPLSEILQQHASGRTIDFLNVDVEMLDLEVLKSMDWSQAKPRVIAVEDHEMVLQSYGESAIFQWLSQQGYDLDSKCHFTTIYKLRES